MFATARFAAVTAAALALWMSVGAGGAFAGDTPSASSETRSGSGRLEELAENRRVELASPPMQTAPSAEK